jgi:hypothetical protein
LSLIIKEIKDVPLAKSLENFKKGMQESCSKMFSASKFIDYFVHDILDYTILNKDAKNFIKNPKSFDIREAIDEIMDIQDDKIKLKSI